MAPTSCSRGWLLTSTTNSSANSAAVVGKSPAHAQEDWVRWIKRQKLWYLCALDPVVPFRVHDGVEGILMTTMKIGQVAQAAGLSVETVRFYEREGLIAKPLRSPAGYRLYDDGGDTPMYMSRFSVAASCRQWLKWNLSTEILCSRPGKRYFLPRILQGLKFNYYELWPLTHHTTCNYWGQRNSTTESLPMTSQGFRAA